MIEFKHDYTERGFCRTHFKCKHPEGYVLHYCLMEGSPLVKGRFEVHLYRCSQDGEPSHTVTFPCNITFETPNDDYGRELLKYYLNQKEKNEGSNRKET